MVQFQHPEAVFSTRLDLNWSALVREKLFCVQAKNKQSSFLLHDIFLVPRSCLIFHIPADYFISVTVTGFLKGPFMGVQSQIHAANIVVSPECISIDPAAGKKRLNDGCKEDGSLSSPNGERDVWRSFHQTETPCCES